jgi:hypothetical protein
MPLFLYSAVPLPRRVAAQQCCARLYLSAFSPFSFVNSLLNGHIKTKALRVWELLPAKFKIDLDLALRIRTFIFLL